MSSDRSLTLSSELTIVPLGTSFLHAPYITEQLITLIHEQRSHNKKTLIFYNRRGSARAWICEDCGFFEKCRHCDLAFAYHSTPQAQLICHHCGARAPVPIACPKCEGTHSVSVGVGIQKIEASLREIFPDISVGELLRVDSDKHEKTSDTWSQIESASIILATSSLSTIVHPDIGAVAFLSFEMNLSIPEYDMEEILFCEISYFKKQHIPILIQTYIPEHPLLTEIMFGNQKSFLTYLKKERKTFSYPPFTQSATIRIHDEKKSRVEMHMRQLVEKLSHLKGETTFLAWDTDVWEKYAGEWQQKITLKDENLMPLIAQVEREIVRNRAVTLEWS